MTSTPQDLGFSLEGVRVVELADRRGEFCGKLLAHMGADVIKVEPPGGAESPPPRPLLQRRARA